MSIVNMLKRIGKALLHAGPKTITQIELKQVTTGDILSDKIILITGGGSGIGLALAKKFIHEGARVIIAGRNQERLKHNSEMLGERCCYLVYDLEETKKIDQFMKQSNKLFEKPVNCIVSNAGVSLHEGGYQNVTEEGFEKQFKINLQSGFFLSQAFLKYRHERNITESANILFMSSETGDMAYDIPYGMTKAAVNSMVGGLSRREYKNGIRVNAIAPGPTVSEMTKEYADRNNLTREGQASGRMFVPEEIAEVATFLLSDASICISGEVIHCNAGNHLRTYFDNE